MVKVRLGGAAAGLGIRQQIGRVIQKFPPVIRVTPEEAEKLKKEMGVLSSKARAEKKARLQQEKPRGAPGRIGRPPKNGVETANAAGPTSPPASSSLQRSEILQEIAKDTRVSKALRIRAFRAFVEADGADSAAAILNEAADEEQLPADLRARAFEAAVEAEPS